MPKTELLFLCKTHSVLSLLTSVGGIPSYLVAQYRNTEFSTLITLPHGNVNSVHFIIRIALQSILFSLFPLSPPSFRFSVTVHGLPGVPVPSLPSLINHLWCHQCENCKMSIWPSHFQLLTAADGWSEQQSAHPSARHLRFCLPLQPHLPPCPIHTLNWRCPDHLQFPQHAQ